MNRLLPILVIVLFQCSEKHQIEVITQPDGEENFEIIETTIDNDSLTLRKYAGGSTFYKAIKYPCELSICEEVFFFYHNGDLMDYKFYIDKRLKFYSRYDKEQNIVQLNGDPVLSIDHDEVILVPANTPQVNKFPTFTPPKMTLRSWHQVNENEDALEQILKYTGSQNNRVIDDDTIGYIFQVKDTSERRITVIWSLEDSLSGHLLKAGKISHLYKGVLDSAHNPRKED